MSSDRTGAVPEDTGAVPAVRGDSEMAQCEVRTCGCKSDNKKRSASYFDAQHQSSICSIGSLLGRDFYAPRWNNR